MKRNRECGAKSHKSVSEKITMFYGTPTTVKHGYFFLSRMSVILCRIPDCCLGTQTHRHCSVYGKLKEKAWGLLRSVISLVCFVTTIDSFFLARGFVANFRLRQNHPLSLPQQHPSCCYGNSIPSSAVYSGRRPSSHEPGLVRSPEAKRREMCLVSDCVLKPWNTMDFTGDDDTLYTDWYKELA